MPTRFIELAGEINVAMPRYVVRKLEEALGTRFGVALGKARILLLGLAYKKNVSDIRESPSFKLIELLEKRGAQCGVPRSVRRDHSRDARTCRTCRADVGRAVMPKAIASYDAVLVSTDHDAVDYALVAAHAKLIVDTRNVFAAPRHRGRANRQGVSRQAL